MHYLFTHESVALMISALLGALIGLERELAGKDPSLRTFSLISLGSCMFTLLSTFTTTGLGGPEPARIAAQIIPGIGFLGAGAIFRSNKGISGLTTAALMWVTAAIGMSVGFGRLDIAISGTIAALAITLLFRVFHRILERYNPSSLPEGEKHLHDEL